MKFARLTLPVLVILGLAVSLQAGELGDKAPNLSIKTWVKGKPVDLSKNDGKHVYVVEFWATWCPPCRRSIPHMTEMQKRFKDKNVTFIGVTDEKESKVKPFVKKMGDKMGYTVAIDDNRKTSKVYMEAFKVTGIPHAFIVDQKNRIVWQGHPMSGLDKAVEEIVSGKYDFEAARQAELAMRYAQEYFRLVSSKGNEAKAAELGEKIMKVGSSNTRLMNGISWQIMTGNGIVTRDFKLALRAAEVANKAAEGKDPSILDTYAMALSKNGQDKKALAVQEQAVKIAKSKNEDPRMVKDLESRLKEYRAAVE